MICIKYPQPAALKADDLPLSYQGRTICKCILMRGNLTVLNVNSNLHLIISVLTELQNVYVLIELKTHFRFYVKKICV